MTIEDRLIPVCMGGLFPPIWLSPEDFSRKEHASLKVAFATQTSYPAAILKHSYSEDEWWYCGHVGIPKIHPWYGEDHGEIVEIHPEFGELSFSGMPEYSATNPDSAESQIAPNYWYFGFSSMKYGIMGIRSELSLEEVKERCEKLAERLLEVYCEEQKREEDYRRRYSRLAASKRRSNQNDEGR